MAITKLMHMKESPSVPYTHLKNAIEYILDVRNGEIKTEGGLYVGGNAGYTSTDILETFRDTKKAFDKEYGRQGYHFVLSFEPGECDATTAYAVARDFCEEYLGENYDYVFALHTDTKHLHAHIVFNSVSRTTGYKYHYSKGDWERYIQPVTDSICKEYGLSELKFEDERVGVSYAQWLHQEKGQLNWSHVMKADIDYAIRDSNSFEDFVNNMKKMNYELKFGKSKKRNAEYATFIFSDDDGKKHRRRSYSLGEGYDLKDIVDRINGKEQRRYFEELSESMTAKAAVFLTREVRITGFTTFKRLFQAVDYYQLPNPYAIPASRVRQDMIRIESLIDECRYIRNHKIQTTDDLNRKSKEVNARYSYLVQEKKKMQELLLNATPKQLELIERYQQLNSLYEEAIKNNSDDHEQLQDQIKELLQEAPYELVAVRQRLKENKQELSGVGKELKMLGNIIETEKGIVRISTTVKLTQ